MELGLLVSPEIMSRGGGCGDFNCANRVNLPSTFEKITKFLVRTKMENKFGGKENA